MQRQRTYNKVKTQVAEEKRKEELLQSATELLLHSKNIDDSLNVLLKRIVDRMALDIVAIFIEDESKKNLMLTNYYGREFSFYERNLFPKPSQRLMQAECSELIEIDINQGTALGAKLKLEGECCGFIYYACMDIKRSFKETEKQQLVNLTQTISSFVFLRTRMEENKREIRKMKRCDPLTGLYNVDAFEDKLKKAMSERDESKTYAVIYLDINNFGYVNDNYGYQVGDSALKSFASLAMEQSAYMAGCHLYSDFFVFLFAEKSEEQLLLALDMLQMEFEKKQSKSYSCSSLGICLGVYFLEQKQIELDLAIENANLAWRRAKQSRKKSAQVFTRELREARKEEQTIIGEFNDALSRGEFLMYLQPKFILSDGSIYGAEALARWQKADGSIVPPGAFLGPLEKIGYVTELDFYIFEELLKTMEKWQKENRRRIVVSTNFSGRHFERDGRDFIERIQSIFRNYRVNPDQIEIEITEGVFVQNKAVLKECMEALQKQGFRIAIDDFGTGYSSLSVLTDIPADVVKIDKSFIDKANSIEQRAIIAEIGKLIQIAGKDVIFEGIETNEQKEFLSRNGFCHGQGYLCNKPIPKKEFEILYMKDLL